MLFLFTTCPGSWLTPVQSIPEGIYGHFSNVPIQPGMQFKNNTYKALRLIGNDYSVYYSVWCSNEKELFNMKVSTALPP